MGVSRYGVTRKKLSTIAFRLCAGVFQTDYALVAVQFGGKNTRVRGSSCCGDQACSGDATKAGGDRYRDRACAATSSTSVTSGLIA